MNKIELLAPAGNFDSAAAALENGADAVYCGMQEFSARKGAKNFTLEQISRLRNWTRREFKKIYITINTILKEEDLSPLIVSLGRLEEIGVDSVILQDPGLARIIRNHFSGIPMHGSTQMAVHNLSGLEILKEAGFSRVVLPREMTIKEMTGLRQALPEMELEVFIHGAQCYGFSGMCLASGMLLNRSANRGECGQVCRTWFESQGDRGYFLSSTDLWAGSEVLKLEKMGITSLKIEGRMKSPAYAAAVSRYYRAILDGKSLDILKGLEEDLRITFSRKTSTGHLTSSRGVDMVDREFPGHRGLPLGKSRSSAGSTVQLDSPVPLHRRDGLMFLDSRGDAHPFSLDLKKTSPLGPGRITITIPMKAPPAGTEFYKIQSHDNHTRAVNERSFPISKKVHSGLITLCTESLTLELSDLNFCKTLPIHIEPSRGEGNLEEKIVLEFSKSSDYPFEISVLGMKGEGIEIRDSFIQPSVLKKIRQQMYKETEATRHKEEEERFLHIRKSLENDAADLAMRKVILPEREKLNPVNGLLPYLTPESLNPDNSKKNRSVEIEGAKYHPLSPLVFPGDEESFTSSLSRIIKGIDNNIGINNWGHIPVYRKLKKAHSSLKWYGGPGMLLANSQALLMLEELTGEQCSGAYGWIEGEENEISGIFTPVGSIFSPPLFISRNCFRKHSLKESCQNCSQSHEYSMDQNEKKFKVVVQECLTWIFREKESPQG